MSVLLDLSSLISRVHFTTRVYVNKCIINRDKEYKIDNFGKSKINGKFLVIKMIIFFKYSVMLETLEISYC